MIGGKVDTTIAVQMLRSVDKDANVALLHAVGAMAVKAKAYCNQMLSIRDHTLAQLAAEGHPYSRRNPQAIHSPTEQVHYQTGALQAGLQATKPVARHGVITAQVFNKEQPLDTYIQAGTRTMVGRPYMTAVRRLYHEAIEHVGNEIINRWIQRINSRRSA